MADFGLPLMLARTTGHESQSALLLNLRGIVKPAPVTHFRHYSRQDVFSNPGYLQYVLRMGNLSALPMKFIFYFRQLLIQPEPPPLQVI